MLKSVLLHIGDPKTGSSSIQDVLLNGKFRCESLRIAYPDQRSAFPIAQAMRAKDDPRRLLQQMRDLSAWAADATGDLGILSAEQFFRIPPQLVNGQFRKHLPWLGASLRVVAYVRPHLPRFISSYAQRRKEGLFDLDAEHFHEMLLRRRRLIYEPRFTAWQSLFGQRFTLRPMVREALFQGDVVADFLRTALGTDAFEVSADASANESLSVEHLSVVARIQELMTGLRVPEALRREIGGDLSRRINAKAGKRGTKVSIDRALAARIIKAYGEDAQRVDGLFFADAPMQRGLEVDLADYPEKAPGLDGALYFGLTDLAEVDRLIRAIAPGLIDDSNALQRAMLVRRRQHRFIGPKATREPITQAYEPVGAVLDHLADICAVPLHLASA